MNAPSPALLAQSLPTAAFMDAWVRLQLLPCATVTVLKAAEALESGRAFMARWAAVAAAEGLVPDHVFRPPSAFGKPNGGLAWRIHCDAIIGCRRRRVAVLGRAGRVFVYSCRPDGSLGFLVGAGLQAAYRDFGVIDESHMDARVRAAGGGCG